jgi:hypothetical protein
VLHSGAEATGEVPLTAWQLMHSVLNVAWVTVVWVVSM